MEIFFLLPFAEVLILVYSFGVGLFLNKIIFGNNYNLKNYSEICLYGFLFTLVITQIINLISPITEIYFWSFLIFSIINIYVNKFLTRNFFRWLLNISIVFILLLPFKLVIKGHDDIYYHLPKLDFITNHKIIFGIGNYYESFAFTNGWSHVGAFFNFFYGYEKNLYLTSFVFFILIINTLYFYFKKSDDNNVKLFNLITIVFLCLKFSRLQEFGNDYQTILLIFLVFNLYFIYFKIEKDSEIIIKKILIYSTFATLFKIHGILINLLLILLLFKKNEILRKNNATIFVFIIISYFSTFITSFVNSGCILYPFKNSCFSNAKVFWSTKENINNIYFEAYNKSYEKKLLSENSLKISKEEWLKNFNWFKFHITNENFYEPFFKSIFLLFLIYFILFKFLNIKIQKIKKTNFMFLVVSLLILTIWIIKIPLMRASGYGYLIGSVIFLTLSFVKVVKIKYFKILSVTLIIFPIIFLNLSNSLRIIKETKKYRTNNIFHFLENYGKNSEKSIYKNFKVVEGDLYIRGKNLKIEKKQNYFFIKHLKKS